MANLTLPSPDAEFAKCPHCGASVKINNVWYAKLLELIRLINASL